MIVLGLAASVKTATEGDATLGEKLPVPVEPGGTEDIVATAGVTFGTPELELSTPGVVVGPTKVAGKVTL